jgi:hypothetical protein
MNSIPSAMTVPTSSKRPARIGSNQHRQFIEVKYSNRVTVSVEHVIVGYPVLAGARQDDWFHLASI